MDLKEEDRQRAKFEAWAEQAKLDLRKHNGVGPGYIFQETAWAWLGWQAACLEFDAGEKHD